MVKRSNSECSAKDHFRQASRLKYPVGQTRAACRGEECGVVHRDLKPSNLMIETYESGRMLVKIIDYGVAKVLAPEARRGRANASRALLAPLPLPVRSNSTKRANCRSTLVRISISLGVIVLVSAHRAGAIRWQDAWKRCEPNKESNFRSSS